MFEAKVGIRRYKFKSDREWQLAQNVYNDTATEHGDTCDRYELQNLFEDGLDSFGVEVIYGT